ncbi:hypothetical protein VTJ04DRAFT_4225 [Mycothermus thermophilus]|uniref:uncharacterized protein n=1 Tax=Humicola insolens TaxID=85995 RepID=UPI00374215FE
MNPVPDKQHTDTTTKSEPVENVDTPLSNELIDTRVQPWKKFVSIPTETKVIRFDKDEIIRMVPCRIDGKHLGG